eukprot:142563-Alexandrium_andersonii.AAC.1
MPEGLVRVRNAPKGLVFPAHLLARPLPWPSAAGRREVLGGARGWRAGQQLRRPLLAVAHPHPG